MRNVAFLVALAVVLNSGCALGASLEESRQLYEDAQAILRRSSGQVADPKTYADAVRKLEKASAMLEEVEKTDPAGAEKLCESVMPALFWARRFANVQVIDELRKTDSVTAGGSQPEKASPPQEKRPPAEPVAAAPKPLKPDNVGQAFAKAEEYEKTHAGDDYAIALRWFQFADEHSGTEQSLRAQARAQEAQSRFQKKSAAAPETPDGKLLAQGNDLMDRLDLNGALAIYEEAKKVADSVLVERRLGYCLMRMGYKVRDDYAVKYLYLQSQYRSASSANEKSAIIARVNALKPLAGQALKFYDRSQAAFQKGLDLAKGKDLECEANIGILCFARGKSGYVLPGPLLSAVLKKYTPANDEERTIYEYVRTLLDVVNRNRR